VPAHDWPSQASNCRYCRCTLLSHHYKAANGQPTDTRCRSSIDNSKRPRCHRSFVLTRSAIPWVFWLSSLIYKSLGGTASKTTPFGCLKRRILTMNVVVVGSGIIGASISRQLAARGAQVGTC
jgi:hypothetical protein